MTAPPRTPLATQAAFVITGRGIAAFFGLLAAAVLSRLLPPETYGTYRQYFLLYNIFAPVVILGIPLSTAYFIPQLDRAGQKTYVVQNGVALLVSGLMFGIGLVALARPIGSMFDNPGLPGPMFMFAIFCAFTIPFLLADIFLVSRGLPRAAALAGAGAGILQTVVVVVPPLLGWGLRGMLWGLAGFSVVRFVIVVAVFFRSYRDVPFRADRPAFDEQLHYSLPLAVAAVSGTAAMFLDKFIVSASFPPERYAIYSNGSFEIPLISVLVHSVSAVLVPPMVRHWVAKRPDEVRRIWHGSALQIAMIFFPLAIILFIAAEDLMVVLFSETYRASKDPFRVLLLLLPMRIATYGTLVRALGNPRSIMVSAFLTLGIGAPLALVLSRAIGILGPCVALVLATYVASIYLVGVACRTTGWRVADYFPWRDLLKVAGVSVAAALPVIPLHLFVGGYVSSVVRLGSDLALYGLVYLLLGTATGVVRWRDLIGVLRGLRQKGSGGGAGQ